MTDTTIGFIGLGNMGGRMARHLAGAGYRVLGYDREDAVRATFAAESGQPLTNAAADLAEASVIITMVPTGAVVRAVLQEGGDDSLIARLKPGSLIIDTTSSPPEDTRQFGAELASQGLQMVDAPISGAIAGADARDLVFMLGSDSDDAANRASSILSHLGKRIYRTGGLGSGHATKSLNNYVSAAGYLAACEALAMGKKYGLDPAVMVDVFNVSTGCNFATETSLPRILAGDFQRRFALALFTKDIAISRDIADKMDVSSPVADLVYARMLEAIDALGGDADYTRAYPFWAAQPRRG